jgi:hypothetical protein
MTSASTPRRERGGRAQRRAGGARGGAGQQVRHYMNQPLVELYGGCMVVLKVS